MYATCTFCHAPLGANEALEHFPVGRRVAYDAAHGRLWAVCAGCRQWNLAPFDERWEAIEEAERLYRGTRLRAATDNIGLARVADGAELIRVGEPLRPEFAAWRYGDRFRLRLQRYVVRTSIVGTGVAALVGFGWVAGVGFTSVPWNVMTYLQQRRGTRRVIARHADAEGPVTFTLWGARSGRIRAADDAPGGWRLVVPGLRADVPVGAFGAKSDGNEPGVTLTGSEAVELARRLLPQVNVAGGGQAAVGRAVGLLEEAGDLDGIFRRAAAIRVDPYLGSFPLEMRLALEMAAHEEVERRALAGELAALEAAWREAEEVAAIADDLALPDWVATRLGRLGGG